MSLKFCWCLILGSLVTIRESSSLGQTNDRAFAEIAPKRPVFPDVFEVKVQGLFKDENSEVDGSLYYDKKNNRAVVDVLWKGESRREIYKFDTNESIVINGKDCTVDPLPDDPKQSFFPFTVDAISKKKMIAPAEMALQFYNSTYYGDDLLNEIPFYLYTGVIDLPKYNLKGCAVTHTFTKIDFETASCEGRNCKPTIAKIAVHCKSGDKEIDHIYQFFHFQESISDYSVFQEQPGVTCPKSQAEEIPVLPSYFGFNYDLISRETQIKSIGSVKYLHKELWYDGDLQLLRVDDYNDKNNRQYTKVYDFLNEVSYVISAKLEEGEEGDIGTLTKDMSINKATFLPDEIFPYKFRESKTKPVYVGKRKVHELDYDVWSVMEETANEGLRVVTDMYYTKFAADVTGNVTKQNQILSHLEVFIYENNEVTDTLKLVETRFIPMNDYVTVPRDWSAFDVSQCFNASQKKALQINMEGPKLKIGSEVYNDVLEQLYLKTVTLSGVSVIRISDLKMVSSNENSTVFKGWILENPLTMKFGKNNTEPDMNTAYSQLEKEVKEGLFNFNVTDDSGEVFQYSVRDLNSTTDVVKPEEKGGRQGYSGGAMAGLAIVMLIVGIVLGVVGLVTFLRSKKGAEAQKLVSST